MVKRGFSLFLVLVICLQIVSAVDTEIKIDTLANHQIKLNFLNPGRPTSTPIMFENVKIDSGESGIISTVFSNDAESFDLGIYLSDNGTELLYELVENITAGETFHALFIPGVVEITKNYQEQVAEPVAVEDESPEDLSVGEEDNSTADLTGGITDESGGDVVGNESVSEDENGFVDFFKKFFNRFLISGFATAEDDESSSNNLIYYGIGFFVVIFLIVLFIHHKKKLSGGKPKRKFASDEDEIADAEEKIREAKSEIDEVRGKTKSKDFLDKRLDEI